MTDNNKASNKGMIYIHVPFCVSRCIYCDFYSTTQTDEWKDQYVRAVCQELMTRADEIPSHAISSIYFGGGTPSRLRVDQINAILEQIHEQYIVDTDAEITLEANPDDITSALVRDLRSIGINRVSLGVQSFDDQVLRMLNRRHDAIGAIRAVETLAKEGLDNVSIDLIYGLPRQTEQMFSADLDKAFSLPIRHLSSYALSVEPGTAISHMLQRGDFALPTEETSVNEYERLMKMAQLNGFEHYEISNFALPGYHSRHNFGYWNCTPYIGVGPGAHSFHGNLRRYNLPDLAHYVKSAGQPSHEMESLSIDEQYDELVFTSLRTQRGLSVGRVLSKFGKERYDYLMKSATPHLHSGRLILADGYLRISKESIMISDDIMSDLMMG